MFNKSKNKISCDYRDIMPSVATFSGFCDRVEIQQHFLCSFWRVLESFLVSI